MYQKFVFISDFTPKMTGLLLDFKKMNMKRLDGQLIGIDAGELMLFSDFEDDGEMWKGEGPRSVQREVTFSETFLDAPAVTLQMSMIDMSNDAYIRADMQASDVTPSGFRITFRTWGDSRVARVRVAWQAIGALRSSDMWDL